MRCPRLWRTRALNIVQARVESRACNQEPDSNHESEQRCAGHRHSADHLAADGFEAVSFQSERPFAVQRFQDFLERLPDNVYRGKGMLWIAESDKRYVFHLVAKRFSLDEDGVEGQARNKLVLIGRNLDRAVLRSQLESCLTPPLTGLV